MISMASSQDLVLVAASDGTLAADVRPLIRLNVSVILEQDGQREQGYAGGGARADLGYFLDGDIPLDFAREAVRQASYSLKRSRRLREPCPSCSATAGPGSCCTKRSGTGSKAISTARVFRHFSGKVGQKVASELCTIVDDGTIANRRGSLSVDDEGTPGSTTRACRERHPARLHAGQAQCSADGC